MHEAQLAGPGRAWFITLSYNDAHLPADHGLHVADWQKFAKRFRAWVGPFRFLACGEYGSKTWRPHWHAALYGHDFEDRRFWKRTKKGHALYRSADLEYAWRCPRCKEPIGHAWMGELTFASAAYVAGYVTKKVYSSDWQAGRYTRIVDGREVRVRPEFAVQSRRPGLGGPFLEKYLEDVFPSDVVVLPNGRKARPPRYYDYWLEKRDPDLLASLKEKRRLAAEERVDDAQSRVARDRTLRAERSLHGFNFEPHEEGAPLAPVRRVRGDVPIVFNQGLQAGLE